LSARTHNLDKNKLRHSRVIYTHLYTVNDGINNEGWHTNNQKKNFKFLVEAYHLVT